MYFRSLSLALVAMSALGLARAAPIYAAIGASDVEGKGSSAYPTMPNGSYVYVIGSWLTSHQSGWTLFTHAVNGLTAPDMRDQEVQPAINENPRIVTVWAGGNDVQDSARVSEPTSQLTARFADAYNTILSRLRNETSAYIITANLPDFGRIPEAAYFPASMVALASADSQALNQVIKSTAAQYNVPVVDLYSDPASYDPANFSSDGFHPNDAGYAHMAAKYERVMLGDADEDGTLSWNDVRAALSTAAGLTPPDDRQAVFADAYPPGGDGKIGLADAVQTARRLIGLVADADWR